MRSKAPPTRPANSMPVRPMSRTGHPPFNRGGKQVTRLWAGDHRSDHLNTAMLSHIKGTLGNNHLPAGHNHHSHTRPASSCIPSYLLHEIPFHPDTGCTGPFLYISTSTGAVPTPGAPAHTPYSVSPLQS